MGTFPFGAQVLASSTWLLPKREKEKRKIEGEKGKESYGEINGQLLMNKL
jgi:hypothetical protein